MFNDPHFQRQAISRAYRLGQKDPCYVYRIVMKGTAEEKVHKRRIMKESVSSHILDGKEMARKFKRSEVKEMLDISNIRPKEAPKKTLDDNDPILSELVQRNLLYDWELQQSYCIESSPKVSEPVESKQVASPGRHHRAIVRIYFHQYTYVSEFP